MRLLVEVQRSVEEADLPSDESCECWVRAALEGERGEAELVVRIVGVAESRALNRRYRAEDAPTNVLSFPAQLPAELGLPLLGDLVVCAEVVCSEAREQGKSLEAHWAHMLVHGTLHLLGYDHQRPGDARRMAAREVGILAALGYANPYQ